jgi:hypothetical protein
VNQIASDLLALNNRSSASAVSATGSVSAIGGNTTVNSNSNNTNMNNSNSVENAILRSTVPIDINETEEITVNGERGIWANKDEVVNWRGHLPIQNYRINEDTNPEVITKRSQQQLVYHQEIAIRYLRPPTPPAPGEILITQESSSIVAPAPPLVIRQQPPKPSTPQPLVVREAPPQPPAPVGRKVITISGKRIPPPPRKVVIERLAPLPSKPQSVIIERWLPYNQAKRRVIFRRSNEQDAIIAKPRNVIIQWEAPQVQVKKEFKDLGVIRANPQEYMSRYGSTLKTARELPSFVLEIKPPTGVVLASDYQYNGMYELEGDLDALSLVDLEREGLGEYRPFLQRLTNGGLAPQESQQSPGQKSIENKNNKTGGTTASRNSGRVSNSSKKGNTTGYNGNINQLIADIFASIDRDNNGQLSVSEAETIFLRLNSRLGRRYGENDVKKFFKKLDVNSDGQIDLNEFRVAFETIL